MNTNGGTVGGGEVLDYWGRTAERDPNLDIQLIRQFLMMPFIRVAIIVLLVIAAVIILIQIFKVRNPMRGRALTHELEHLDRVKKHDEYILNANRSISILTKIIEKSPFSLNKSYVDYWSYNLSRANIRIPGGIRVMRPEEFNALIASAELLVIALSIFICIFLSAPLGIMMIILAVVMSSTMPMTFVRQIVKAKDLEITVNFVNFYLMIHYVLLASAGTPISGIMKSYDKTTDSEEMHRFVDVCIHYIDTYGEYEATRYIAKQYREIPQVGKLMRLIRQANEGGDVRAELMGFRDELLAAERYAISKRMEKLIAKAKMSFNLLVPVLIQAIISAMAIYLDDLSLAGSLF